MTSIRRIDTHAHFVPPQWRKICLETGYEHPDGMPAIPVGNELIYYPIFVADLMVGLV